MKNPEAYRKTSQHPAPARAPEPKPGRYNMYPSFPLGPGAIRPGFDSIADEILRSHQRTVVIDGFVGVLWEALVHHLSAALQRQGDAAHCFDVRTALLSEDEIRNRVAPYLGGDDPLFGTRCPFLMADFFDETRLRQLRPDSSGAINIVYGTGAALSGWGGLLLYVDVPKNEVQFRSRAGSICNLGEQRASGPQEMYKRFYFVDWPVLNRHRRTILERIDMFVDEQRPDNPAVMSGENVRKGLGMMATNCFRPRPWFEPGPWGGQWIKQHVPDIAKDVPNYAWSFELIAPENGLSFSSDGLLFELSLDFLMLRHNREVLGAFADQFGFEFPIRYDFLDTFGGGNLSVQCHPRPEYIRKHFGEAFTQDECYYILDCKPGARVYLGFQRDADTALFRRELERSIHEETRVDIDAFVNSEPANKHDLFLIPHGTIHCSGVDNLVLEISATPYIFTFKMYDWLRKDLEGNPRTLNIGRAFDNLCFDRKGDVIAKEFISRPAVQKEGPDWRILHLPTHPLHFYDVHRLEFSTSMEVATNGSCHVLNLVDGESIVVETSNGFKMPVNFAETFVIPAAAGSYRLVNSGSRPALVVKTFLKPDARPHGTPEGTFL